MAADEDCWLFLQEMILGHVKSFALKAVVDLGIPNILAEAAEKKHQLTVSEIAEHLPSKAVNLQYLDRLLTYASSLKLLELFVSKEDDNKEADGSGKDGGGRVQRRFGFSAALRNLLEDAEGEPPASFSHVVRFFTSPESVEPFAVLGEAVLTGVHPFKLKYKESGWEHAQANPQYAELINLCMSSSSNSLLKRLLNSYKGFSGIRQLVDVGGGLGSSLSAITRAYPGLQGINFDLPNVIAEAPEIPGSGLVSYDEVDTLSGVKHVGGSMFESVPQGDAIFMKYILHNCGDADCVKILRNCLKSLPPNGKLIIAETVLKSEEKRADFLLKDIVMLTLGGGRERNVDEWRLLLGDAGFQRVKIFEDDVISVIEGYKI